MYRSLSLFPFVCLSNASTHMIYSIDWYFLLHLSLCWASFCLLNLHYFVSVVVNRASSKKRKKKAAIKFYVKSIFFSCKVLQTKFMHVKWLFVTFPQTTLSAVYSLCATFGMPAAYKVRYVQYPQVKGWNPNWRRSYTFTWKLPCHVVMKIA